MPAAAKSPLQAGEVDRLFGAARRIRARVEEHDQLLPGKIGKRDGIAAIARQAESRAPWCLRPGLPWPRPALTVSTPPSAMLCREPALGAGAAAFFALCRFCPAGFCQRALSSPLVSEHSPAFEVADLPAVLGDFLRVFLDIRLPFDAFGGSINGVLRVLLCDLRIRAGCWAILMTSGYGYKDFEASPVRSLKDSLGPATAHSKNRGLAAMPAQERSMGIDGRALGGEPTRNQRQHREAMARNSSPQNPQAEQARRIASADRAKGRRRNRARVPIRAARQWDEADWDHDQDEAAGHRARSCCRVRARAFTASAIRSARCGAGWSASAGSSGWRSLPPRSPSSSRSASAGCGGGSARARSISTSPRPGSLRRSRKISATATRSRSAAPRSSAPGASASPCASATSSCATATAPSSRPHRRRK